MHTRVCRHTTDKLITPQLLVLVFAVHMLAGLAVPIGPGTGVVDDVMHETVAEAPILELWANRVAEEHRRLFGTRSNTTTLSQTPTPTTNVNTALNQPTWHIGRCACKDGFGGKGCGMRCARGRSGVHCD